jgi:23S rRNA (guanine2445-N2)-methyltransferase / 23S rRNA (guanine2069-N7)-methyltransferase
MASGNFRFFATTAKGMEPQLGRELKELGAPGVQETRAGASFEGGLEVAYRACLWSRVANRILLPLKTFHAPTPEKLYGGVKSIRWSDHLMPKNTLAVDFASSRSQITHTHFGALKSKDAIVDQLRSIHGERPSVDPANPDVRVNIHVNQDEATVSIDLSGESLHRRGYRDEGVPAPLKENLAAALLLAAGWGPESGAFLDPMCGSGTLPIEAALIAARIAPGIGRKRWGFSGWLGHYPKVWERLIEEARDLEVRDPKKLPRIVGYDADFRSVRAALANVERAGFSKVVHIEKRDLEHCEPVAERGLFLANPPYGERIGARDGATERGPRRRLVGAPVADASMSEEAVAALYERMGDVLKQRFKGWEAGIFTANADAAKRIGLRASRRLPFFNGALECRLFLYSLY